MKEPLILVIDDSLTVRKKLKMLLEGEGMRVLMTETATEGTRLALEHHPHVVILDVVLPDGNGLDLCASWHASSKLADLPVLLTSGTLASREDRAAGLRAGALGYIAKPFSDLELLAQVGMLLRLNETHHRLRESESLSRALVNAPSESSILIDREGTVLACNEAAAMSLGMDIESLTNQHVCELLPADLARERKERVNTVFATGKPIRFEETRAGKTYDTSIYPVTSDAVVTACAIFSNDISARKRVEASLIAAKEQADAANKAKSEFLATMSHELRTPMNSIIGFTEMMINDPKDPPEGKRARRLEKVHRNAKNLLTLINDILDLSKVEADRLTLEASEVDVIELLSECIDSAQPLVKAGRVELHQSIDDSLRQSSPWVGDSVRLRQIVTNLLSNAAKFTEAGQIQLRASVRDRHLQIEVEDTGIGMSQEDLQNIFEKFHQVDSSSTRRAGGTGLGLAICRELCMLMNGDISVTSTPQVGSCFTVRLPMLEASGVGASPESQAQACPPILYVGSSEAASHLQLGFAAQAMPHHDLQSLAYVNDLRQAIERCQACAPGKIWLDPFWGDTLQLLSELKSHKQSSQHPVGLLGASEGRYGALEFDDCVAAPLGKDTLMEVIRGVSNVKHPSVLLICDSLPSDCYVRGLLTESSDVTVQPALSVSEALTSLSESRYDAVVFGLLRGDGVGMAIAWHLREYEPEARPRLIAVIPRDPTVEQCEVFRSSFRSHILKNGFGIAEALHWILDETSAPALTLQQAAHSGA